MKLALLIITFALFSVTVSAQEKIEVFDTVLVKVDDVVYTIRVAEKNQPGVYNKTNSPPFRNGFFIDTSSITCDLLFEVWATRKTNTEVLVTLHIATMDKKKSSTFNERVKLKKGEKKDFKLKSKLKCMYDKSFLVSISY